MHTHSVEHPPYKQPTEVIGESKRTLVHGYEGSPVVTKVTKSPYEKPFESVDIAKQHIQSNRNDIERIRQALTSLGSDPDIVVPSEAVIHQGIDQPITYSYVQRRLDNAKPLTSLKRDVFTLSPQTLKDLRNLFQLNINLQKAGEKCLDIVGSNGSHHSLVMKAVEQVLPLLFSENIMIDEEQRPRLIDTGLLEKPENRTLQKKGHILLQLIGSHISVKLLDAVITLKGAQRSKKVTTT